MSDSCWRSVLHPVGAGPCACPSPEGNHRGVAPTAGLFLALVVQLCLPCVLSADSVVVINEIMYHPRAGEPEWIELHNQMGTRADLSGWSLTGAVEYVFRDGTILPANSYVVVASSIDGSLQGIPGLVLGPFHGQLSNGGEEIRLENNSGRVMNRVRYDDDGDWPAAPDGGGVSLAKIDPERESETPSHWTWSDEPNGTPGAANFHDASPPVRPLRLNEVCPAGQSPFFVEIVNIGTEPVIVSDAWIEVQGPRDSVYTFEDGNLAPGEYVVVTSSDLGFVPRQGDRLFLGSGDGHISDAVLVASLATGRHPAGTGPWLFPAPPTPGQPNQVELCADIVINEIMYHPLRVPRSDTVQALSLFDEKAATKVLVPQDDILGRRWTGGSEPFDDRAWIQGAGTGVGYEAGSGYEPYINIDVRAAMQGRTNTVYIRIPFEVTDPARLATLILKLRYDDGFLAFLNGTLVASANVSASAAWNDPATSHDDTAAVVYESFNVSDHLSHLRPGANILAIEGHNAGSTSSDLLFQATLEATEAGPGSTAGADDESKTWVELYNKGTEPVDLSRWKFDKGISYTFPEETFLQAGGYLVVARDRTHLASLFPDVSILGDFEGRLANDGEELQLLDARGNPVDQVRYYDGGTWPAAADGGGSSLELRDSRTDNDCGSAWGPSDESIRSAWQPFSYRGVVQASSIGNDNIYHEFAMGLLDAGEILIDDIHVIENPAGQPQELLQNSDFLRGLDRWRIIGNHRRSDIRADPNDPGNPVLHLVASGSTEHMHNHAETTFANGAQVSNGREVEVRFRARWLTGSPLLHTRLFFNRLARTTVLPVPARSGTPGLPNSCHQPNIGPTLTELQHTRPVPLPGEPVTVSVKAGDPDGIAGVTLWYRPDNGQWLSTEMVETQNLASLRAGLKPAPTSFIGQIPGYPGHSLVQFYVEAVDERGIRAYCPAAGEASFAQYRVLNIDSVPRTRPPWGQATGPFAPRTTGVFNYRIVMRDEQTNFLFEPTNLMSNEHLGATLIVNERDVYYDIGVRLKGSEHGRPQGPRIGFQMEFNPEKLFRDVHRTVGLDRSDGQQTGQREMLFHAAMNRFGGFSKYYDLGYLIAPREQYCSGVEVQLARYGPVYCKEAYGDDGGSGTVFEYELVYTLAQTVGNDPEGLKIPQEGGGVYGRSVTDYLGTDKEMYRWHFLIKNNRDMDDYGPVIDLTRTLSLSSGAFAAAAPQTIDVDQWLHAFAVGSTTGVGDNWISNSRHNAMFYFRPTDERVLYFLHDLDYAFQQNQALESNDVLRKLLQTPAWAHAFYGYVYEFLQLSFNRTYLSAWASHYGQLLPEQGWSGWLDYIDGRSQNVMSQLTARAGPPIPFAVTSPADGVLPSTSTPLRGRGWIDVQEVRIMETSQTLVLDWSDLTTWETRLPADLAPGPYTLAAYDGLGKDYYWKVVEVNDAETPASWEGSLWRLATVKYLVVDDFESYKNDSPDRVFQTWIDGAGFSPDDFFPQGNSGNGTGALIGYDPQSGNIMQTARVHAGRQSVPFYYGYEGKTVSEATRTFDEPQDWTKHGIRSLGLYFTGAVDNKPGQLYVRIDNGAKLLYQGAPEDLRQPMWVAFNVDLAAAGTNLMNVRKLTIGVEGAGATGTLLIDDIRLYPNSVELVIPAAPAATGLLAHYKLDGDGKDAAGSHHGTLTNMPAFVAGKYGQALNVILDQYINVPYSADLSLNTFTVAAWVNVSDITGNRGIIGTRFNGDNTFDVKVSATLIHGDIGNGTAWLSTAVDVPATLSTGEWYHIAYAFDDAADTAELYVNGIPARAMVITGTPLFMKSGQDLRIGTDHPAEPFRGMIDDVRIYNRPLSAAEVAGLADRTAPAYKPF